MFKSVNSVVGGIIKPQAIATGDPNIYKTTNIVKQKKWNFYKCISWI